MSAIARRLAAGHLTPRERFNLRLIRRSFGAEIGEVDIILARRFVEAGMALEVVRSERTTWVAPLPAAPATGSAS